MFICFDSCEGDMSDDRCDCRIIHEEEVEAARADALADKEVLSLSQVFKCLGDPSRLRILTAIEKREMCVCDLAALLGVSESAASHQLRLLRTMHLVKNRRQGPILYYSLADTHVSDLILTALEHIREG